MPDGGINRFAWTPELAEVTAWVGEELTRLGLDVEIDAAGNLLGRWPAPDGPAVMTASHLDTVPNGGAFDGVLGVLAAVEAVRILRAEGFEPARPIWVGVVHGRGGHALRHGAVRQPGVLRRRRDRGARGARQGRRLRRRGDGGAGPRRRADRRGGSRRRRRPLRRAAHRAGPGPARARRAARRRRVDLRRARPARAAARRDQPRGLDSARDAPRRARRSLARRGRPARGDPAPRGSAGHGRADPRRARRPQRDPGAVRVRRRPAARGPGHVRRPAGLVR